MVVCGNNSAQDFTPWMIDIQPYKLPAWLGEIFPSQTIAISSYTDLPKMADTCQTLENALYGEFKVETHKALLARARLALARIPDASCDSIAAALGLKPHAVRALSKGMRKGKEFYQPTEILNIINTGEY